jgi:hypothetical protein
MSLLQAHRGSASALNQKVIVRSKNLISRRTGWAWVACQFMLLAVLVFAPASPALHAPHEAGWIIFASGLLIFLPPSSHSVNHSHRILYPAPRQHSSPTVFINGFAIPCIAPCWFAQWVGRLHSAVRGITRCVLCC